MGDELSLRNKAAITGIGELKPMTSTEGRSSMSLICEAARLAIEDAGIEKDRIDGLLIAPPGFTMGMMMTPSYFTEYLKLKPTYANVVDFGGASATAMVLRAAAAIATGQCETVLCLTGDAFSPGDFMEMMQKIQFSPEESQFEHPYGPMGVNYAYALAAQRHMHEYGTTSEQMAKVAVDQRTNACLNPDALFYDQPITIDHVLNSRLICDPLHLLDIVKPVSGAAAVIVSAENIARNGPHPPAWLLGAGEALTHSVITYAPDLTTTPIVKSAARAFSMSGLSPKDMNLISVYDCYTIMVIMSLEDAGFCKKGHGGSFVQEHDLTYSGDTPVNTHGGQLSFGQAGLAGGMSHVTEAVRQLRGNTGARQVKNCDFAFVNGNGGVMSEECSLVLGR